MKGEAIGTAKPEAEVQGKSDGKAVKKEAAAAPEAKSSWIPKFVTNLLPGKSKAKAVEKPVDKSAEKPKAAVGEGAKEGAKEKE